MRDIDGNDIHTHIVMCCRKWIAPFGYRGTRCGLCGEVPVYHDEDPGCECSMCARRKATA